MDELKLIWNNDGKHNANSCRVSVRRAVSDFLCNTFSPMDVVGTGSDFGSARENFAEQLTEYIEELIKFRDEVVETKRAYEEAIMTDCNGKPLRGKLGG